MDKNNIDEVLEEFDLTNYVHGNCTYDNDKLRKDIKQKLQEVSDRKVEEISNNIEKLEYILKDIKSYENQGEIGTLCEQGLLEILKLKSLQ